MKLEEIEKKVQEFIDSQVNWSAEYVLDAVKIRELIAVANAAKAFVNSHTYQGICDEEVFIEIELRNLEGDNER